MKKYITEEIYPKSQTGKCMVYFNMSHHYRRIYSAKPRIDSNLIKRPQAQQCCSSSDVFNFVKRNSVKQPLLMTPRHEICTKDTAETEFFKPKILESQIESKLKSLPVYQAPQRILTVKAVQTESSDIQSIVIEDNKDIKENSLDNTQIEKCTVEQGNENKKCKATTKKRISEGVAEKKKFRPLDKSSVLFLKDITDDILRKGVYSNQSLEKLFVHHISRNKYFLPKEIMEKEVLRLKKELEMPLQSEKHGSDETVKDEEALTALDSLFLPSDIKEKVASSLGLARKSPPLLPSPKDSFTGSLELTSISENKQIQNEKLNESNSAQEINRNIIEQTTGEAKEGTMPYVFENTSSNENSNGSAVIGSQEYDNEANSNKSESFNRTRTLSPILVENVSNNTSKLHKEFETSSDLSSIHTESDL